MIVEFLPNWRNYESFWYSLDVTQVYFHIYKDWKKFSWKHWCIKKHGKKTEKVSTHFVVVCKNYGRDLVGSNWVFYGVQGLTHEGVNIGNFHIKRPGRYRLSKIGPKSFWGCIIFLSLLHLCGASGASNIQWWILGWISTFYIKWGDRALELARGPCGCV